MWHITKRSEVDQEYKHHVSILYLNILERSEKLTFLNALQDGGVFLMYLVCKKWTAIRSSDFGFDEQSFVVP